MVSYLEVDVRHWILLGLGVLLALLGVLWILQGLDLLGQSGGMNGHPVWAVVGLVAIVGGVNLVRVGLRSRPSSRR